MKTYNRTPIRSRLATLTSAMAVMALTSLLQPQWQSEQYRNRRPHWRRFWRCHRGDHRQRQS